MIPVIFLLKGATFCLYTVGIAFIYDFCSPEMLKNQFTYIIIITTVFSKGIPLLGSKLYEALG